VRTAATAASPITAAATGIAPKCQGAAAKDWLAARQADLLPVGYFHIVFTLPAEIAGIAWQNKAVVYDLLFRAASEAMLTIGADPKRLGAKIGITAVLHTWGSAMTHHPHVHMIVPGGGISLDGERWVACRPGFFLPVRVLLKRHCHGNNGELRGERRGLFARGRKRDRVACPRRDENVSRFDDFR
jgi:hypothetical protein